MAGLLAAPAAVAEPFTPELEADYASALAWWGVSSPPQCASVTREVLAEEDPFGEGVAGRTTQPVPGEFKVACVIHLFEPALDEQFPPGCPRETMMKHEVGHLLGNGHSSDPDNIMGAPFDLAFFCPEDEPVVTDDALLKAELRKMAREERREQRRLARHHRHAWVHQATVARGSRHAVGG